MCKRLICLAAALTMILLVPASADMIGYWKLDEGTGTVINDSSDYGHDGTIDPWNTALVDWTTDGYKGNALEFNTTTGEPYTFVDVPLTQGILNISQASYTFWMRMPQNHQPWGIIFDLIGPSTDYSLEPGDAGELYNYSPWFGNTSVQLNDNQWHHVAVTFGGDIIIYADGEEIASNAWTGSGPVVTVRIGGPREYAAVWASFTGTIDEVTVFNQTLSPKEIEDLFLTGPAEPSLAFNPSPSNGSIDLPRDTVLEWTPGENADKHNVYFGTVFDDVNSADTDSPLLVSPAQDDSMYGPGRLDLGQSYYWRIDEIDSTGATYKGSVWSFTVEPFAYPVSSGNIIATASSFVEGQGPENTINNSGITDDSLHSTQTSAMWLSVMDHPGPTWIQYEFEKVYKLDEMLVWNYNGSSILSWSGIKEVTVEYSTDGTNWTQISDVNEFTKAPGTMNYDSDITVKFDGVAVKYVRFTPISNWSNGLLNEYGLSEVRFMYIPVSAREPSPAPGATGVAIDTTLSWRPGREAAEHHLFLSDNQQAVIDNAAFVDSITQASYGPLSLDMETDYYWRIDEVNLAQAIPSWESSIWTFKTSEYLVVDDFESYNDIEQGQEGSNLVYDVWIDGYANPSTNGSTIGYITGESMESDVVHSGLQSVPLKYDNGDASLSEVTVDPMGLQIGRDWTKGGATALVLWFYGDPNNAISEQMYVSINGTKVLYDGDYNNLTRSRWTQWNIDLTSLGVNQNNITTLSIGFEGTGATVGSGTILIDDIRLYRLAPPVPVPTEPSTDGLVAYYTMDNNVQDQSGNGLNGTLMGNPTFVAGKAGLALSLDGQNDYVDCNNAAGFDITDEITLSAWVNTNDAGNDEHNPFVGKGDQSYAIKHATSNAIEFFIYDNASWQTIQSPITSSFNGVWHHVAGTYDGTQLKLYIDGGLAAMMNYEGSIASSTYPVNIGRNSQETDRLYEGSIDEVRIYNRALSEGEILYLANL